MPDPVKAAARRNWEARERAEFAERLLAALQDPDVRRDVWQALRQADAEARAVRGRPPAGTARTTGQARNLKTTRLAQRGGRHG